MVITRRLATIMGANGGRAYIEATWDDIMEDEFGVPQDPNATMLVSAVGYQNLSEKTRYAYIGGVVYPIPAGTQSTTRNIPKPQQTRIDSVPYFSLS